MVTFLADLLQLHDRNQQPAHHPRRRLSQIPRYTVLLPTTYGVFTARIRRVGEGTVFTGVYLSTSGGGYPSPRFFPGHWSHVLSRGGGGYPRPGQGGTPVLAWGHPWPGQDWGTPPWPGQDGISPPPTQPALGYSPPPPPGQNSSRISTCYAPGGMSLAFIQEDFLVTLGCIHRGGGVLILSRSFSRSGVGG